MGCETQFGRKCPMAKIFCGGSGGESANSIQQTSDGGFIIGGGASSIGAGSSDAWVIKLDSTGNIQWQKSYGGTSSDGGELNKPWMADLYFTGNTSSFSTRCQAWLLKLDANGNVQWQKAYNGTTYFLYVYLSADGGYLVGGDGSIVTYRL